MIIPRYALLDNALYDKGKYDEFRSYVSNFDWSVMKNSNLEESWSLIKNTLKEGISQYVPNARLIMWLISHHGYIRKRLLQ